MVPRAALAEALDHLHIGIAAIDARGVVLYANAAARVALEGTARLELGGPGPLTVSRGPAQEPMRAVVQRTASIALLFIEPAPAPVAAVMAQRLYGLTAAEARVAVRVLGGDRINDVGAALGVRKNTVRTHLKRAYAKLGVSREAGLVRRLDWLAAIVSSS